MGDERALCESHGTWYPFTSNTSTSNDTNNSSAVMTMINGTCACHRFWESTYCTDITLAPIFPFHWSCIGLWIIIFVAAVYFAFHLAVSIRHARVSWLNVQLIVCVLSIGTCVMGIRASWLFMHDVFPEMPKTDVGFPTIFVITCLILTLRRVVIAAARMHAPTRLFIRRTDRVSIFFTVMLFGLAGVNQWITDITIVWNIVAGMYGACVIPGIYRAIQLLSGLLPNTQSHISRQLIRRNTWLLRGALLQLVTAVALVSAISIIGRSENTIVQWNIIYSLENVMLLALTSELVVITGRSVHEKYHHTKVAHLGHPHHHSFPVTLMVQPSRLHSFHSRALSFGGGGVLSPGHTPVPGHNGGDAQSPPAATGPPLSSPSHHHHNSQHSLHNNNNSPGGGHNTGPPLTSPSLRYHQSHGVSSGDGVSAATSGHRGSSGSLGSTVAGHSSSAVSPGGASGNVSSGSTVAGGRSFASPTAIGVGGSHQHGRSHHNLHHHNSSHHHHAHTNSNVQPAAKTVAHSPYSVVRVAFNTSSPSV